LQITWKALLRAANFTGSSQAAHTAELPASTGRVTARLFHTILVATY
jgi:hypothetical protein